jgi:hypothetical protein
MDITIVIASTIALFITAAIILAVRKGLGVKKEHDGLLRGALQGLDLRYESFYRRLYAFGAWRGNPVNLHLAPVSESGIYIPGGYRVMVLCAMKVPRTEGLRLHLAVLAAKAELAARAELAGGGSTLLRKSLGWSEPEPGFFLATRRGQSPEEALALFRKLTPATKSALLGLSRRYGSIAVAPDIAAINVGRQNAVTLAGGDPSAPDRLDLQVKLPADLPPGGIMGCLDEMESLAEALARDLGP